MRYMDDLADATAKLSEKLENPTPVATLKALILDQTNAHHATWTSDVFAKELPTLPKDQEFREQFPSQRDI